MEILQKLKDHASLITTALSLVGAIGGAVVYVENNYAHASDVNQMIQNQQRQILMQESNQRANALFQLEYYDDRISRLNAEKRKAIEIYNSRSQQLKSASRTPEEIQSDIDDIKRRKEIVRQSITSTETK